MVILVVALIVLGPKRLPEAGRQVGKALAEVRKWSQGFQNEIKSVMEPDDTSRPSYYQPQPGYDPPPIPIVPAETASSPEAATTLPAESNGTTTGSHGEIPTSSPADWTPWDRPAPPPAAAADTAPPEPPGPPAGELPST